jgi:hypothetical protein
MTSPGLAAAIAASMYERSVAGSPVGGGTLMVVAAIAGARSGKPISKPVRV